MNGKQNLDERLSSCMDGELDDIATFLEGVSKSDEAKACWHRYHLIRDVIADDQVPHLPVDFSSRVMQAIEKEPTVISPRIPSPSKTSFSGKNIIKPAVGLAIAATVAAVTVMGLQVFKIAPDSGSNVMFTAKAINTLPLNSDNSPASFVQPTTDLLASDATKSDDGMSAYLIDHMEYSRMGVQGGMPYVRVTGYDNNQ